MRHWNNGTDHRHSKSCCDKSSPARRTMMHLDLETIVIIFPDNIKWGICFWIRNIRLKPVCLTQKSNVCFSGENMWHVWRTYAFVQRRQLSYTWWRHQMKTFSALPALCEGIPPVSGGVPSQRPVTRRSFQNSNLAKSRPSIISDTIVVKSPCTQHGSITGVFW